MFVNRKPPSIFKAGILPYAYLGDSQNNGGITPEGVFSALDVHATALREGAERKAKGEWWERNLPILIGGGLLGLYIVFRNPWRKS